MKRKRGPRKQFLPKMDNTPLVLATKLGRYVDLPHLYLKLEGKNPSGTHKDRPALAIVRDALSRGYPGITVGTCGNFGASIAMLCNVVGLECKVFIPKEYEGERNKEITRYGAEISHTEKGYEEAVEASSTYAHMSGFYDANPNSLRGAKVSIEGYATLAEEVVSSLKIDLESVWIAVGNGTALAGIDYGFRRLGIYPKFGAVSSKNNNQIIDNFYKGKILELNPNSLVKTPVNEILADYHSYQVHEVIEALKNGGMVYGATDDEMLGAAEIIKQEEKIQTQPASASVLAGISAYKRCFKSTKGARSSFNQLELFMERYLPITDRDHTYLSTADNIFFCVAGNLHSKEHIFGMPYYFLTKELEEILDVTINEHILVGGKGFSKLLDQIPLSDYPLFIKKNYPDYYFSPPMWEVLMKVDRSRLRQVFDPRVFVRKIKREHPLTADEENSLLYTLYKLQVEGFSLISDVGVTGSVLLSGDVNFSGNDVDLIFHKMDSIRAVRDFSTTVLQSDSRFTGLCGETLKSYVEKKKGRFSGTDEQLARLVANRWDILFVDGVKLDLNFCEESRPDSPVYDLLRRTKPVSFKAEVAGISDSYFLPTRLKTNHDRFRDIIITARGYVSLFNLGDMITVDGYVYVPEESEHEYVVVDDKRGSITLG